MLQAYFLNLWNKYKRGALIGLLIIFSTHLNAQSGFYQNFEKLIKINKENYLKKLEKLTRNLSELNDLVDPNQAELDPDFINTLIFYTPSRYSALVSKDKCSLYDIILADLAQSHEGDIRYFIIRYKNKAGEVKSVAVNRSIFMEKVAYGQCPSIRKFNLYFNLANIKKTLKGIVLKTPTSDNQCLEIHQEFMNDYKTPYLCKISEKVAALPALTLRIKNTSKSNYKLLQNLKREQRITQQYLDLLNEDAIDYLDSLCQNLEKPKVFCESFFKSSFWERALSGERSKYYVQNICQDLFERIDLNARDLKRCVRKLSSNKSQCHYLGKQEQVLLPKPNCEDLSKRLNRSHLFSDYYDCPGLVANDGIVNVTRIINHLEGVGQVFSGNCSANSTLTFAKFINELTDGRFWNVGACYEDKIYNREECFPMVYGELENNQYSMGSVIKRVLTKTRGFGENQNCEVISEKQYEPKLLKFKTGCFIIFDRANCYGTNCKFRVVLDEREINNFKIKSGSSFDYFPKDFKGENYAMSSLLKTKYKLKTKSIINIAFLKSFFKDHPKSIMHGIACAEDLLPNFYNKTVLNQCRPLPFIIDGYKENKGLVSVIMRTAHDGLHAPRLVPWSYLYSSLKDYQRRHPLNLWGLHAIYR
jgi:hypothetical protein